MDIYLVTNRITGKQYVGQTTRTVKERWADHCSLTKNKHRSALRSAIAKYGSENFSIEIIDSAVSLEELNQKEVDWINKLNTLAPYGYNLEGGGKNKKVHSLTKLKMSIAKMGVSRPWTNEQKKAMSIKKLGKSLSLKHRAALKAAPRKKIAVKCLTNGITYACCRDAAIALDLENEYVYRCIKGIQSHAKGFRFEVAIGQ